MVSHPMMCFSQVMFQQRMSHCSPLLCLPHFLHLFLQIFFETLFCFSMKLLHACMQKKLLETHAKKKKKKYWKIKKRGLRSLSMTFYLLFFVVFSFVSLNFPFIYCFFGERRHAGFLLSII